MDTFSSSLSSFKVPTVHPIPREIHQFKTSNPSSHLPQHHHHHHLSTSTTATKPTSISFSHQKSTTSSFLTTTQFTHTPKQTPLRRNAASGYAAALIDAAVCNNSLESIQRDVKRLSKWLGNNEQLKTIMTDPFVADGEKGRVIKEVVEKGRFRRHLVVLVKMLVKKNELGMVGEVLDEFERIYDELSSTLRVVLVSSEKKTEEDKVFGIAKMLQKLSGGMKVRVRHLNLIDESTVPSSVLPSST